MMEESLKEPRFIFTLKGNILSEKIVRLIISQKRFKLSQECLIVPQDLRVTLFEVAESGVYIFDSGKSEDEKMRFLYGQRHFIPQVFGVQPVWGVRVFQSAQNHIETIASDIAEAFQIGNFQKMLEKGCFPWGQEKRKLIA